MASYTSPSISGYNSSPPSDDGSESVSNRVDWSTIKEKLTDPVESYSEAIDTAADTAFTTIDSSIATINTEKSTHVDNSNGDPTVSSTLFQLDSLTVNTYESIGPTAATSDYTWTALDSVPVGVDWIEVAVEIDGSLTGTTIIITALARKKGSASTDAGAQNIGIAWVKDGTSDAKQIGTMNRGVKIPVDSTIRFDGKYTNGNSAILDIDLYLTGYGWN